VRVARRLKLFGKLPYDCPMERRSRRGFLPSAVLAAVLVVAQTAALAHVELGEAHPLGDACLLCAGLATLGAANVATITLIPASARDEAPEPVRPTLSVSPRPERALARGPPPAA